VVLNCVLLLPSNHERFLVSWSLLRVLASSSASGIVHADQDASEQAERMHVDTNPRLNIMKVHVQQHHVKAQRATLAGLRYVRDGPWTLKGASDG
jgi:hypothetical protein